MIRVRRSDLAGAGEQTAAGPATSVAELSDHKELAPVTVTR
jgi:hypothetical protein